MTSSEKWYDGHTMAHQLVAPKEKEGPRKATQEQLPAASSDRQSAAAAAAPSTPPPHASTLQSHTRYSSSSFVLSSKCGVTPCLLPEQHLVTEIQVQGPRYWQQQLRCSRTEAEADLGEAQETGGAGGDGHVQASAASYSFLPNSPAYHSSSGQGAGAGAGGQTQGHLPTSLVSSASLPIQSPDHNSLAEPTTTPLASTFHTSSVHTPPPALSPLGRKIDVSMNCLDGAYHGLQVFVKKKAGFLSYSDDPTGIRSLLSRTVIMQHTKTPRNPRAEAAESSIETPGAGTGAGARGGSQRTSASSFSAIDIVHLCGTFSVDPSIMSLARYLSTMTSLSALSYHHELDQWRGSCKDSRSLTSAAAWKQGKTVDLKTEKVDSI